MTESPYHHIALRRDRGTFDKLERLRALRQQETGKFVALHTVVDEIATQALKKAERKAGKATE